MLGTSNFIMHRVFGPKSLFQISDPHCTSAALHNKHKRPLWMLCTDFKGLSDIPHKMSAICLTSQTEQKRSELVAT